jgi:hypothetical protein
MSCRRAWGAKHDRVGGTFWARSTTRDEGDGRGFGSPIPLNNCACPGAPDACPAQPRRRASSRIPQQHRSDFAAPALRFRGISARIPQHQRSDSAAPALGFRSTSAVGIRDRQLGWRRPRLTMLGFRSADAGVAAEPRRSEQAPPEPRPRDQRPTSLTIKHLLPLLTSLAGSDSGCAHRLWHHWPAPIQGCAHRLLRSWRVMARMWAQLSKVSKSDVKRVVRKPMIRINRPSFSDCCPRCRRLLPDSETAAHVSVT